MQGRRGFMDCGAIHHKWARLFCGAFGGRLLIEGGISAGSATYIARPPREAAEQYSPQREPWDSGHRRSKTVRPEGRMKIIIRSIILIVLAALTACTSAKPAP